MQSHIIDASDATHGFAIAHPEGHSSKVIKCVRVISTVLRIASEHDWINPETILEIAAQVAVELANFSALNCTYATLHMFTIRNLTPRAITRTGVDSQTFPPILHQPFKSG